jgi:hypothetical protein
MDLTDPPAVTASYTVLHVDRLPSAHTYSKQREMIGHVPAVPNPLLTDPTGTRAGFSQDEVKTRPN